MDTVASQPLSVRPFAALAKAVSDVWSAGPVPCWTEYLRAANS